MDKLVETKIREKLGKGALYEIHPYRGDGYEIIPKKKDFTELSSWDQYCSKACIADVSQNTDSAVLSELRMIFGNDAKFLYFSESSVAKESMSEKESVLFTTGNEKVFTDLTGCFIACQPKKKELNFSSFPGVELEDWYYGVPER